MSYFVNLVGKNIYINDNGSNLSIKDRKKINDYVKMGFTLQTASDVAALLPMKSSAKEAPFVGKPVKETEDNMFKKYEVVFSMRQTPQSKYSGKMLARLICDSPDKLREYISSSCVKVYRIWPVGRVRGQYLKDKGVNFHTLTEK